MNDAQLRIGDAERDLAAAELGEHYVQGRLTSEEHTARLDRIWSTRTRGELAPIFRDLPATYGSVPARGVHGGQPERKRSRRGIPAPVWVVLAVLGAITVATHLPVVLAGLLVALFVLSRRRRRYVGSRC